MAIDGLEKLLDCYSDHRGVITVQPYHRIKRLYENFSAYFNLILMAAMNTFTPLGRRLRPIGAFGPCLLCERGHYFKIGGHSSAKSKILEDLEIGKKFIKNNIPVYCYGGRGTIDFRMYPNGIGDIVNGFSRGFTSGARSTSIINLILVILWIAASFYPITMIIENALAFNMTGLITGIIFYFIYALQLFWMLRRIGNFSPIVAVFFPVFMIFFVLIFFWSIILNLFRINIKWKGRNVNHKRKKE